MPHINLAEYDLLDTIGTGTFGRVRLARHKTSGNCFALKIMRKADVVRTKQVDHVNCERALLTEIDCPRVVKLHGTSQDHNNIYMLFEYINGGELFSHLRRAGRFTNSTAKFYAAQIVSALDYLHQRKIVYRDLKPENLLLDGSGHLKLADFGFAKRVEDRTWTLCGTPEYLAPEIIKSMGHDTAVDWWALGVLIYEMLAGYPPFFDDTAFGIYEKILAGRIEFPKYFDPLAVDLITQLLTRDRTRRLGNLKGRAEDVRRHKWFITIDWPQVHNLPSPILPQVRNGGDTRYFDKYVDTPEPAAAEKGYEDLFTEF